MASDLEELLHRIRTGQISQDDHDTLERHLTFDSMVPGARNRAAYGIHLRHHGNAGYYVHLDLNDFGRINKEHGEDVGDQALRGAGAVITAAAKPRAGRVFRKGGDEFVAWFLRPEDAEMFAHDVKKGLDAHGRVGSQALSASIGIGRGRQQAEAAQMRAKSTLYTTDPATGVRIPNFVASNLPTVVHNALQEPAPGGWREAEDNIKQLQGGGARTAPDVMHMAIPGAAVGMQYPMTTYKHAAPAGYKDETKTLAKQDMPPHPVLHGGRPFVMMTAENPCYDVHNKGGMTALAEELKRHGYEHQAIGGFYNSPEQSFLIYDMPMEHADKLAKDFGQESFMYSNGKDRPAMVFANGTKAGMALPTTDTRASDSPFDNYYSVLPTIGGKPLYVQMVLDDEAKMHPARQLHPTKGSHPVAYPWHDDGTETLQPENLPTIGGQKLGKAEGNDQAAGVGVSTFKDITAPYGTTTPGTKTNIRFYDYRPFEDQIDALAKKHGYEFKFFGGKYGNVDLKKDNYNTGKIMIYDPTPGSGGDFGEEAYTRSWRKIHELAHAMTYKDLNAKYGEGRRIGKLGHHRTPHEARRAVEWEWLVAAKQRQLGEQIGHHVSDEAFAKETNTVMADAVHRAIHGTFTEPGDEGFTPHDKIVPLETSLGIVSAHQAVMGLGDHETLKMKKQKANENVQPLSEAKVG